MPRFCSQGETFDSGELTFDLLGEMGADLCTFDSTLTTFDSTSRTFDQTTCQDVTPEAQEPSGGAGSKRKRQRWIIRKNGRDHIAETLSEAQRLIDALREVEAVEKPKKRNKKRPVAKLEAPQGLQAELYKYDLPNIAPMVKSFDFSGLQAVMDRLYMIQQAIEEEEIEMLVLH